MDLKLLEDLRALADERSFVRAAEVRHVTHPAFGRRIRTLEAWAGVPLVERRRTPVQLTPAGLALLQQSQALLDGLLQTRDLLRSRHPALAGEVVRVATGRTLARTLVADWLARLSRPRQPLHGQRVEVHTRAMTEVAALLERGEADFVCCYEHPATSVRLSSQRFRHLTLANDRLVPVSRANAQGRALHGLQDGPLIAYAASLSLGALVREHLQRGMPGAAGRTRYVCDSADAIQEFVLKGLGVAWLPWSMVAAACKNRLLVPLGARSEEVHFQVRLYRPRARQSPLLEAVWAATDQ
ncbi:LysR family transcriptional regulator [Methylibium rhizosphaerae]|uniref:LysR family transcriptional regulator n=1 Tax=Methylibium rhizosphaerae TaxID=2570323 RepID=UPI00112E2A07|nr:LysR family transcriptional regulator [Methylibium rhizosphaerae]